MLNYLTVTRKNGKNGKTESSLRWYIVAIMSLALSVGTWNPSGFHFVHFIMKDSIENFDYLWILFMVGSWILAIKAIFQTLKFWGAFWIAIMIAALMYGLSTKGYFDYTNLNNLGWVATIGVAFIIFVGLNASVFWKYVTGVYTTDSTDL